MCAYGILWYRRGTDKIMWEETILHQSSKFNITAMKKQIWNARFKLNWKIYPPIK